ncbi:dihydropteroate synthase [candidate division WOR-1 bacterium RIFOXYA12_FULL_52_29]|uniref:Dihydropteroate synthase n=1 Tax=candidate division WOR-1 bacterium RIFOXYC12_FULL_54_18 TaxID=1802584 RepID=A0A1F4T7R0_UNCSA|nr:MAG: dihydropteroate synthase [candidate division WOR-1 bacterium RIFOXYA2_FULL_51_19]OGC17706.1 MAG: dihydropteroate synthase [candidate division WOR-1 bacterium RIFOXYA12_FULL_52_29]OGC26563.1 MAG: dihydropteroate synthase [candidate division WOR-1 bacterium RIFOXYB2_FULL_45_9]OGC28123.1 MAG: dihydropteroate synthase [candidate division WOR-1 bacterium RIFOXYC12_FULL_54_18]OGC29591.1 MAG: dihydropteroate synthase [candidate division WOR-1 bacterium RIFOXYB12_FULL_52_16]
MRIIEINNIGDAAREMSAIGVDPAGIKLMSGKAVFRAIKVYALRPVAANILKQEALSFGAEVATAYGSIDHSVKTTEVIVCGTIRQLLALAKKLKAHQFGLPGVGSGIEALLAKTGAVSRSLEIGKKSWHFGRRTYIMGIVNVTPDSFSDGGNFYSPEAAAERALELQAAGADIVDIGGESTRPGARTVPASEEISRVVPVIRRLTGKILMSIDTRKAEVARAALEAGAEMVNDVSGLRHDRKMAATVAGYRVPVCVMHAQGSPAGMQKNPKYHDLMGEIASFLEESIEIGSNAGILPDKFVIDPGLGFGKRLEHNIEIVRRLKELKCFGLPLLVGPSRKSMIGQVLDKPVGERLFGTAAAVALAVQNGADIIRVHDVSEIKQVIKMTDAIVRRI